MFRRRLSRRERAVQRARDLISQDLPVTRQPQPDQLGLSFVTGLSLGTAIGILIAAILLVRREPGSLPLVGSTRIELLPNPEPSGSPRATGWANG